MTSAPAGPAGLLPAPSPALVRARLETLRARITRAGRDPATVRVVAVTKGFDADTTRVAATCGLGDLGENYAAELLLKAGSWDPPAPGVPAPRWHYLGAVQRRKVRQLAPVVTWWQSVARLEEARSIAEHAPGALVLLQVDLTGRPGRNGVGPGDLPVLAAAVRRLELDLRGLMVVAPPGPPEVARTAFANVAALARDLGLAELSMGMSGDFEAAVAEGATMIRAGRALFGERPARPGASGPGPGEATSGAVVIGPGGGGAPSPPVPGEAVTWHEGGK